MVGEFSEYAPKQKPFYGGSAFGYSGFPSPATQLIIDDCNSVPNSPIHRKQLKLPTPHTPRTNSIMTRIQRDMQSPSASIRMRAINALKDPTISTYSHFDIPFEQQNILATEVYVVQPTPIAEIMKGVVAYVDVRSGEDNRTDGIKKIVISLGAKVQGKVTPNTTHVIFKDGSLAVYKKARSLNIPVVSILWVEACKNFRRICDSRDYPISDIDRYENPELYEKKKRIKSMQPDSEIHKRIRHGTPKDSTPKGGSSKKSNLTPTTINTPRSTKKQTDLSKYLTKLHYPAPNVSVLTTDVAEDSPTTKLVDKCSEFINYIKPIEKTSLHENSVLYSDKSKIRQRDIDSFDSSAHFSAIKESIQIIEAESNNTAQFDEISATPKKSKIVRRYTQNSFNIKQPSSLENVKFLPQTNKPTYLNINQNTPKLRRRSAITALENINNYKSQMISAQEEVNKNATSIAAQDMDLSSVEEEKITKKTANKRRTTRTAKELEVSVMDAIRSSDTKSRRTLYTPKAIETDADMITSSISAVSLLTPKHNTTSKTKTNLDTDTAQLALKTTVSTTSSTSSVSYHSSQSNITNQLSGVSLHSKLETAANLSTPVSSSTSFQSSQSDVSTTAVDVTCSDNLLTPAQEKFNQTSDYSLLEEHASSFSSTRRPGSHYSVHEALMDIVTQRVQNINKSARRSILPRALHSDFDVRRSSTDTETPVPSKRKETLTVTVTAVKETVAANINNTPIDTKQENKTQAASDIVDTPKVTIRKRKLFMPNDSPLPQTPDNKIGAASPATTSKRRRTLMPVVQPMSIISPVSSHSTQSTELTSSSLVMKTDITKRFNDDLFLNKKAAIKFSKALESKTKKVLHDDKPKTILNSQNKKPTVVKAAAVTKKKSAMLVCTNMHTKDVDFAREAVKKLGNFQLEKRVNNFTTHVITTEPKRTLNLLRGLVRGLWILNYAWILDSVNAGKWLQEEPYEIQEFSRSIKICRAERQAFGNKYKSELFAELEPFYISPKCTNISKEDLEELILLGGGKLAETRKQAKYIVCEERNSKENKIHITYFWVLDSLTQMELCKVHPYAPKVCCVDLYTELSQDDDTKSVQYNSINNARHICK